MFHVTYLKGLCHRRNWPEPTFEIHQSYTGYTCTVRVNSRDFSSPAEQPSTEMAMDQAACQAYIYCRDFSKNAVQPRSSYGGKVQGVPVAIGTGRTHSSPLSHRHFALASPTDSRRLSSSDSGSDRRSSFSSAASGATCPCGQMAYRSFDRCEHCLRRDRYY